MRPARTATPRPTTTCPAPTSGTSTPPIAILDDASPPAPRGSANRHAPEKRAPRTLAPDNPPPRPVRRRRGPGPPAALYLSTGPAAAAVANLLGDPGFESGPLTGWTRDAGTAAVLSAPVHSGSHALSGTPTSSDDAACTQTVAVQPNTAYTLSGFVEGSYVFLGVTGGNDTWTPSAADRQQLSMTLTGASQTSLTVYRGLMIG